MVRKHKHVRYDSDTGFPILVEEVTEMAVKASEEVLYGTFETLGLPKPTVVLNRSSESLVEFKNNVLERFKKYHDERMGRVVE